MLVAALPSCIVCHCRAKSIKKWANMHGPLLSQAVSNGSVTDFCSRYCQRLPIVSSVYDDGHQRLTTFFVLLQVTIGSTDLKANHMIEQIVDVISEHEKYDKYVKVLSRNFLTVLRVSDERSLVPGLCCLLHMVRFFPNPLLQASGKLPYAPSSICSLITVVVRAFEKLVNHRFARLCSYLLLKTVHDHPCCRYFLDPLLAAAHLNRLFWSSLFH